MRNEILRRWTGVGIILSLMLSGCAPMATMPLTEITVTPLVAPTQTLTPLEFATPLPQRPEYGPGELVDYIAQTGDTLPALAERFNTSIAEILQANPFIPADATTMPPGMPMKIPIYYRPFWGTAYQILPDSLFINGPAQIGFDTAQFLAQQSGWLNGYTEYAAGATRSAANVIDYVALHYSISPRLLLALLEYQSGAVTQPAETSDLDYPMAYRNRRYRGLYLQLVWAANLLNDGYYRWRAGIPIEFEHTNGRIEQPDPWQNAATISFHNFFLTLGATQSEFNQKVGANGFAAAYRALFGDPWQADVVPHIPGSLQQPTMQLPFEPGKSWAYTGGPHTGWGSAHPWAAIDFAPPSVVGGCVSSDQWVTAVADGVVTRSEIGIVEIDLDGDGDSHTGWTVFYLHLATEGRAPLGKVVLAGEPIGHPSCEGGSSTGTHVHIARRYNGEWIAAYGTLAFNFEGWVVQSNGTPYFGTLNRFNRVVTSCTCSNAESIIKREKTP